jgi:hypothetical protein
LRHFWLSSKLKNALNRQRFTDIPDIQHMTAFLHDIPEDDFQNCYWQWHRHLTKSIVTQGEYLKVTATTGAQVSKFCFQSIIPVINAIRVEL